MIAAYLRINVTGGKWQSNGTTSMPKSVPRFVVDKVRLVFVSVAFVSSFYVQRKEGRA